MRIVTTSIEVYKFSELSEAAKETAVDKLYDINVNYEWWDGTYEDARRAGFKISAFDTDRANLIKGTLEDDIKDSLRHVLEEHGNHYETYKIAKGYRETLDRIESDDLKLPEEDREGYDYEQEIEELAGEYCHDMLEEYLCILRREYEYQTSEESIIETIKVNEYEFDKEGALA